MTIEHIRWFSLQAEKKGFGVAHWAVYCCLAADCAIGGSARVFTSYSRLAARIHCGRQNIPKILTDLSEAGLLKVGQPGEIELHNPDPDWLKKVTVGATTNQIQNSPNNLRARKAGAVEDTPPRGTLSTGQNLPSGLPPMPQTQAKALNARQQLELYQRLGWKIPITLKQMAELTPDEVWTIK